MPITIDSDGFEFDLVAMVRDAGNDTCEFNMFLEVSNVLIIYPVKIDIRVVEGLTMTEPESVNVPARGIEPEVQPILSAEFSTID